MDGGAISMARSVQSLRTDLPVEIAAISVLAMAAIRAGTAEHSCDSGDELSQRGSGNLKPVPMLPRVGLLPIFRARTAPMFAEARPSTDLPSVSYRVG